MFKTLLRGVFSYYPAERLYAHIQTAYYSTWFSRTKWVEQYRSISVSAPPATESYTSVKILATYLWEVLFFIMLADTPAWPIIQTMLELLKNKVCIQCQKSRLIQVSLFWTSEHDESKRFTYNWSMNFKGRRLCGEKHRLHAHEAVSSWPRLDARYPPTHSIAPLLQLDRGKKIQQKADGLR